MLYICDQASTELICNYDITNHACGHMDILIYLKNITEFEY